MEIFLFVMLFLLVFAVVTNVSIEFTSMHKDVRGKTKNLSKNVKLTPIKLTVKAVIRWEQLTGRPFSSLNYSDNEDVEKLLYVSALCSADNPCTFEVFQSILKNQRLLKGFVQEIEKDGKIVAQFQQMHTNSLSGQESGEPGYFKDIVYMLIQAGVNPHYLMNEAELCDLPELISAYERNKKEQMEASRLWTFLTILPHIDSKKIQSAKDIYPFPWEMDEEKEKANQTIQNDTALFEAFMKKGRNLFN